MSRKIKLLCSEKDREALQPLLEQLRAKGLHVLEAKGAPQKDDNVLAVLTEHFYADEALTQRLLDLIGAEAKNVLPLQLDGALIPDAIKNALYARNIIPAAGRDDAHTAERILSAFPPSPPVLPRALIAGGALLLALIVGALIWRGAKAREAAPVLSQTVEYDYEIPAGWTQEDLAKIVDVIIVGDTVEMYSQDRISRETIVPPNSDDFAYRNWENDGPRWYSREEGHPYSMTRYEDLRFLSLMPNLRYLYLVQVEAEQLPDLSVLGNLDQLELWDCSIPDLEWVAGSCLTRLHIENSTGSIRDFSPLTRCEKLQDLVINLGGARQAEFAGFAPPNLRQLALYGAYDLQSVPDLSGLRSCAKLNECHLCDVKGLRDLSFLSGPSRLETLELQNLDDLKDISVFDRLHDLLDLSIQGCDAIEDLSHIGNCRMLQTFSYRSENGRGLRDASFLAKLDELNDITLENVDLPDVDFLKSIWTRNDRIQLRLNGSIGDYSGLEAVKSFGVLSLDPDDGCPLDRISPYLQGKSVNDLILRNFGDVDLSALPTIKSSLTIIRCGITDLSTMPEDFGALRLTIEECRQLSSLDGLQNQSKIGQGFGMVVIRRCPRLADWTATDGLSFGSFTIDGGFTLPSFEGFHAGILRLESVADVTDLSVLDAMDSSLPTSFELVGLDELTDLSPLSRFHGSNLVVPPQLAEQAADLVRKGNFSNYRIEFPEGGWENDSSAFVLSSLDELETLPEALLRHVSSLCLAGDQLFDPNRYDVWYDWGNTDSHNRPALLLHDMETDETTPIKTGTLKDLSRFFALTGLKELRLYAQPLTSLDGIQVFSSLESLDVCSCYQLKDASAAFAVQSLRDLNFENTSLSSIQGVQNLSELRSLAVDNTEVSDLSPLRDCDLSAAYEEGGLHLEVGATRIGDFSPLSSVRRFRFLNINVYESRAWLDAVSDCEIVSIFCRFDSDEALAAYVEQHPETEELHIDRFADLTDLTPILKLEQLRYVGIPSELEQAIASLDGQDIRFTLDIN